MNLPLSIRLPLLAAALIFVAAVASTQVALHVMSREVERVTATLGSVYLDGLSAAVLPHVRARKPADIQRTLEQALTVHEGVLDRQLAFFDADGALVASASREGQFALPTEIASGRRGPLPAADGSVWFWRELREGSRNVGQVVACLDLAALKQDRSTLRWGLLASDLAFSSLFALLGFWMVGRLQRPMALVARHLYDAALGRLRTIDVRAVAAGHPDAERIVHAYNAMVSAAAEKEALLEDAAAREREALLGRLAATIAHEVRNPLAGMKTALGTLQRFGTDAEARDEAVGFLVRGIQALEQVVDATLASYRQRPAFRALTRRDIEDLRLLVEPDSVSRGVTLELQWQLPVEVRLSAFEVRQILLNLLLNAVRETPPGGRVRLHAGPHPEGVEICVEDQGPGMKVEVADALELGSRQPPINKGLGVSVVVRLVERLHGRVHVDADPARGTRVRLTLPWQQESAGGHAQS